MLDGQIYLNVLTISGVADESKEIQKAKVWGEEKSMIIKTPNTFPPPVVTPPVIPAELSYPIPDSQTALSEPPTQITDQEFSVEAQNADRMKEYPPCSEEIEYLYPVPAGTGRNHLWRYSSKGRKLIA